MSLLNTILLRALSDPRRVAVIDDRREYTYLQVVGGAMFLREQIEQATAKPNVGLLLPTSGAFPMAMLGCWLARRTAVAFNYLLNKDELAYVIGDSGIDTLITVGPMLDFLGGPSIVPPGVRVLKLEDVDFHGMPPLRWPPMLDDDETAVILYTSGTSARPKGVMLTHRNLQSNVLAGIAHAGLTRADVFLGVLPQFHSFGLMALTLIPLTIGARVVYSARFVPKKIIDLMRQHRPDIFLAVPSMYGALLSVKDATAEDVKSIRMAVSGGEPLPESIYDGWLDRFNVRLLEGYGLTETSPAISWCTLDRCRRKSVGTTLPGVDLICIDEAGGPLPVDVDGEIVVRGPSVMKGYYNLPEKTREVMIDVPMRDGTTFHGFRTGDLGHVDEDGFLYITGRKKEMLKVAGEIVVPREIEEALNLHPDVHAAAVIGKSDGLRGEVPVAFVEMEEGRAFKENELRAWCRERLASFKVPRVIRHIDALPRNPTGKIMKRQLKAD